jgi:pseudaminic acid synthase
MKNKVFIIAEMSANHCGKVEHARQLIDTAKAVGADAIKIQTYTADTLTLNCHNEEFKISGTELWNDRYLYDLYQEASTPWEWQTELKAYADSIGLPLFSTPFDASSVDFLEKLGVTMYKIASFESIDIPLIRYVARLLKPMIISTGICSFEEMQEIVNTCKECGNHDITLLKCISSYPARLEDMNLMTIGDMREKFCPQGVNIGLSDHSLSIIPPVASIVLGATVIEKHFTLDRNMGGPDAKFSLEPDEFRAMVTAVRDTETALGTVNYSINEKNRRLARSLYVVKNIRAGETITASNIRSVRPSNGLHPRYYDIVLGRKAKRDLNIGTPLSFDDLINC